MLSQAVCDSCTCYCNNVLRVLYNKINTNAKTKLFCENEIDKINLKWIIDPNVRAKTMKRVEENIGDNLWDVGLSSNFLGQKAQTIREKSQ